MPILPCPECKNPVSDQAKACPKCGHPIADPPVSNPGTPPANAPAATKESVNLVQGGYVLAVIMPLIGLILGIVLLARRTDERRHGAPVIILAIVATLGWAFLFSLK